MDNNIKKIRKKKNITQKELADMSGLSHSGLWNYENGKRTPKLDVLNKIAEALDVSVNNLVGRDCNKIEISETQALQLLAYMSYSNPTGVEKMEQRILIELSESLMWDIAEKLSIENFEEVTINPITLKIENWAAHGGENETR